MISHKMDEFQSSEAIKPIVNELAKNSCSLALFRENVIG